MRYARAKWQEYQEILAYRVYMTDSLQLYSQNKYYTKRYIEMIHPKEDDSRDGNDIACDVISRLGLKTEKDNECI